MSLAIFVNKNKKMLKSTMTKKNWTNTLNQKFKKLIINSNLILTNPDVTLCLKKFLFIQLLLLKNLNSLQIFFYKKILIPSKSNLSFL